MSKHLLIVEESLRDLKAHWFEYIKHITAAAKKDDWQTTVVCHTDVAENIKKELDCLPVFKHAKYLDHGKKKYPGEHYYSFILHSYRVFKSLKPITKRKHYDFVFCPTTTMHHLLAWYVLLKLYPNFTKKLCLFFVTNPGVWDAASGKVRYPKTTKLFGFLLNLFSKQVKAGRVKMAVETVQAKKEFEHISKLAFSLLPHAVTFSAKPKKQKDEKHLHMACYGFARYEKGSDLLQDAIIQVLQSQPNPNIHFSIQWTDDFTLPGGTVCSIKEALKSSKQVSIIDQPLNSKEYQALLEKTDIMLLPYRNASYYARVSRVAIEATNMGIPCVYTSGGWLEETIRIYGSGIAVKDESIESLVLGIQQAIIDAEKLIQEAKDKATKSIAYFKPDNFWSQLVVKDYKE